MKGIVQCCVKSVGVLFIFEDGLYMGAFQVSRPAAIIPISPISESPLPQAGMVLVKVTVRLGK